MFHKMKKKILQIMNSVSEYLEIINLLPYEHKNISISSCLNSFEVIMAQLNKEEIKPQETIELLQSVKILFEDLLNDIKPLSDESKKSIEVQLSLLKVTFEKEITIKLNIVFFPYKASMWDSLETIYEAALKDENTVVKVVPIPYYQLTQDEAVPTYEGEHFPKNISIVHYTNYILEEENPDIIFIHNMYDNYNTLTRVFEQYFTANLKKYTDMLVYVPYHMPSFIIQEKEEHNPLYNLPSIRNVDKIIFAAEYLKKEAISFGIPDNKILVLGSPKIDALIKVLDKDVPYPEAWKDKIKGKTVYLINTGCMFFAGPSFIENVERLTDFFNIPKFIDNTVVMWRPHPLTKASIQRYSPYFLDYYLRLTEEFIKGGDKLYHDIILDETQDYLPALLASDVLITTEGSLLRSYLFTEKKIILWDKSLPENSLLPNDVLYYAFDRAEPWYELAKKFSEGYDPLAVNRKGVGSKIYVNADGSSGTKILNTIKAQTL